MLRPVSQYRIKSHNLNTEVQKECNKSAIYEFPDLEIKKKVDMGYGRDLHVSLLSYLRKNC
jgi:hypothetical protein